MPAQAGSADTTGAEGVMALPQLSVTFGGVGGVASERHATVEVPLTGNITVGAAIVYT